MGNIDPVAAARAASAAAGEAARAAAEAAAAAAAAAAGQLAAREAAAGWTAGATSAPTIADPAMRQVLADTGVILGGVVGEDASGGRDLAGIQGGLLGGAPRESLMDLPQLDGINRGGLTGPPASLDLTITPTGGSAPSAAYEYDLNGWNADKSRLTREDGWTTFSGNTYVFVSQDGTRAEVFDLDTFHTDVYEGNTRTEYVQDEAGKQVKVGEYETHSDDNVPLWSSGVSADEVTAWVNSLFGGDEIIIAEDDDSTTAPSTGSGAAASAGDVPAEDAPFNPPPGWIDPEDVLGVRGAVHGAKGGDPEGGDDPSVKPGPQGGDTTVNPGSEGTLYDIADKTAWVSGLRAVDMVGQPAGPDVDEPLKVAGTLAPLRPGPGPEVINPGDPNAGDADAQASTAYRTSDADPDAATNGGMAAADPFADVDGAAANESDQDREARGRDFGQSHGHGGGRDDGDGANDGGVLK